MPRSRRSATPGRTGWTDSSARTGSTSAPLTRCCRRAGHGRRLVRVDVPASFAHWVAPGACYNRVGYYEVPNARVVYRDAGTVRSFGIASMISWRGVWYVVHLGAVSGDSGGMVDAPSAGAGVSAPSLTC